MHGGRRNAQMKRISVPLTSTAIEGVRILAFQFRLSQAQVGTLAIEELLVKNRHQLRNGAKMPKQMRKSDKP